MNDSRSTRRDPKAKPDDAATLAERTGLVTGASEGLGFACALQLARAGWRVAICGRRPDILDRARAEIERDSGMDALAIRADLTDPDQIEALIEQTHRRFGRLDLLVANPGGHPPYGASSSRSSSGTRRSISSS